MPGYHSTALLLHTHTASPLTWPGSAASAAAAWLFYLPQTFSFLPQCVWQNITLLLYLPFYTAQLLPPPTYGWQKCFSYASCLPSCLLLSWKEGKRQTARACLPSTHILRAGTGYLLTPFSLLTSLCALLLFMPVDILRKEETGTPLLQT